MNSIQSKLGVDILPVMESFYTVQGEGFHQGKAAYFVRLAGCDVGCVWCDVKESWDENNSDLINLTDLIHSIKTHPSKIVVVTGGEPTMYDLAPLTEKLKVNQLNPHLETSGAHPLTGEWDWICFSPKKFMAPLEEYYEVANELKVVVYNKSDFKWAEQFAPKVNSNCKLFLQPEWSKQSEMLPLIIEYVKCNPHWEISLQIHKFMNVP